MNFFTYSFALVLMLVCNTALSAQNVAINDNNANADPSAMLDVQSTTKGMLVPRMTSAQRTAISNAAVGLLVFDTNTESFWFRDGSGWTELVSKQDGASFIQDTDKDTKVQTEKNPDEDIIRFDVAGAEKWVMRENRLEPQNTGNSVFIGKGAGNSGAGNVLIGHQAGQNATGDNNIFIGAQAGANEAGNDKLIVGSLLYGEQDNNLLRVNGTLDINNAYRLPTADGTPGQVLQTDGSGQVNWATGGSGGSGVPSGTILAFGGATAPSGFLSCNGSAVSSQDYPDLFAAIGTAWGGDGAPNFNLPDLRGQFLRGWDNGAGVDPGASGRTNLYAGGQTGNNTGSYQSDAFQGHWHNIAFYIDGGGGSQLGAYVGNTNSFLQQTVQQPVTDGSNGSPRISNETRPKNAYVQYIIKY